jgi:hypothetical protein
VTDSHRLGMQGLTVSANGLGSPERRDHRTGRGACGDYRATCAGMPAASRRGYRSDPRYSCGRTAEELAQTYQLLAGYSVSGTRYPAQGMASLNR